MSRSDHDPKTDRYELLGLLILAGVMMLAEEAGVSTKFFLFFCFSEKMRVGRRQTKGSVVVWGGVAHASRTVSVMYMPTRSFCCCCRCCCVEGD